MDPTIRLRLATRIHFALLRQYDEDIAVSTLLRGDHDASEALWVCEASGQSELVTLARQFKAAPREMPKVRATGGRQPQELAWAADTSGFGVSQLTADAVAAKASGWLSPSRWMRLGER